MSSPGPIDLSPPAKYGLFEFIVGGLFCIGLPGLLTGFVPVSWIDLQRVDDHVHATTRTCVFFYIPYKTQELAEVTHVSTTFKDGEIRRERHGNKNPTKSESMGTIELHGPPQGDADGEMIAVAVSPASTKEVEAKINAFLADPQQKEISLFTVANWKFGIIFAIPLCLLTLLFIFGWTVHLLTFIIQFLWNPLRLADWNEVPLNSETSPLDRTSDEN